MTDNVLLMDNKDFDFSQLNLVKPNSLGGGLYFSKLLFNNSSLLVPGPKCLTKN